MRKFGLVGYPLGHSFSKKFFSEKFHREGIQDCTYENFPLRDIGLLRKLVSDEQLCGLNITIPYKTEVIPLLDRIDPQAEKVGAVNVIKIKRHSGPPELTGYNSDIFGIAETIRPVKGSAVEKALVLGSGGSSKSVCHVLSSMNIEYISVSRKRKPGFITYGDIDREIIQNVRLIVNTTPVGMFPDTESFPDIDYDLLGPGHILFDLVYNPEMTTFLRKGKERGCTVVTGTKMLHSQAEKSWEIWNSEKY